MTLEFKERDFGSFFDVPFRVYPDHIPWVSMLRSDLRDMLDTKKNPHWQNAEGTYYTAFQDGVPVGRIVAHVHHAANALFHEKAASFGFFDVKNDPTVATALLEKAEAFGRARGMTKIRGNMNLTANQEIGCVVEGDDRAPFVAQIFQPVWVSTLLRHNGYAPALSMSTFVNTQVQQLDPKMMLTEKHQALLADTRYTWRQFRMDAFDDDIEIVRQILNDSMSNNTLFVPLTEAEAKFQLGPMKMIMNPRLTRIAEFEGTPIAATICIPDPNPLVREIKSRLGPVGIFKFLTQRKRIQRASVIIILVRKEHHGKGVIGVLNHDLVAALQQDGFTELGGTWIADTNKASLKQTQLLAMETHHRCALFEKAL